MEDLSRFVISYAFLPVLFPAFAALVYYKAFDKNLRFFSLYIFIGFATEMVVKLMWLYKLNNLPLFHAYTIVEFVLLTLFFRQLYRMVDKTLPLKSVLFVFLAFTLINTLFFQPIFKHNTSVRTVEAVVVCGYCLVFFYYYMKYNFSSAIFPESYLWITAGLFIYFSANVFLFIFSNYLYEHMTKEEVRLMWASHGIINGIKYLLITIGLWKFPAIQKSW